MVAGRALPPETLESLRQASQSTGVDFDFLVAQARAESGFRGDVRSHIRHSTAAGLFQFTAQTWMQMMREHGAKYGHAALASQIGVQPNGHLGTGDRATDKQILDLRQDVGLSALFAGELAKANAGKLRKALGRPAGAADLHLAHLLCATGAIRFLRAHQADATQPAAAIVPAAAKQNPSLFFDRGDHSPNTVAAVYRNVQTRMEARLKHAAAMTATEGLRPGLGLSDALPRPRRSEGI